MSFFMVVEDEAVIVHLVKICLDFCPTFNSSYYEVYSIYANVLANKYIGDHGELFFVYLRYGNLIKFA